VFDVDEIPEHGGSLRIYAQHDGDIHCGQYGKVAKLMKQEDNKQMQTFGYYESLQYQASIIRRDLLDFLISIPQDQMCVAYGAAAKGNTFLNYCGIHDDLVTFVVDRSPHKQGKYLPGSHIAVLSEENIKMYRPEYVLILAWNLKDEIMKQLSYVREWGGKFLVAIPKLEVM
jgi:hypothetical protein